MFYFQLSFFFVANVIDFTAGDVGMQLGKEGGVGPGDD